MSYVTGSVMRAIVMLIGLHHQMIDAVLVGTVLA